MNSLGKENYPELEYFINEDKSDVVFLIDGMRVPALKVLMSMKSPVFEVMFSDKFKESNQRVIKIKETTYEAFKAIVCFVYTDRFVIDDKYDYEFVANVCELADRYQMLRLLHRIDRQYKPVIAMENFEQLSHFAFRHKMDKMMTSLKAFMATNFTKFKSKPIEDIKRINDLTDNSWLEILTEKYLICERKYFKRPRQYEDEFYFDSVWDNY